MRVLQESKPDGTSNRILLYGEGTTARVLKLFRRRSGAWRESFGAWWSRAGLRKVGFSLESRFETERRSLELWRRHGFDVPRTFDEPLPDGVEGPGLWFEHLTGPLLSEVLADSSVAWDRKRDLLRKLGAESERRHSEAEAKQEPLLIQEHATVQHRFVEGDRLVAFDFESGYGPGHPLLDAMADEVSGMLRSLLRFAGEDRFEAALGAYVEGYADRGRLLRIAERGSSGGGLRRMLRRWADRKRRGEGSKADVMDRLFALLAPRS